MHDGQAYAYMGIDWYTVTDLEYVVPRHSWKIDLQCQVQKKKQKVSLLFFVEELYYWRPGRILCGF